MIPEGGSGHNRIGEPERRYVQVQSIERLLSGTCNDYDARKINGVLVMIVTGVRLSIRLGSGPSMMCVAVVMVSVFPMTMTSMAVRVPVLRKMDVGQPRVP